MINVASSTRKYSIVAIYGFCSRAGAVHGEWMSLHDELVCWAPHAKAPIEQIEKKLQSPS